MKKYWLTISILFVLFQLATAQIRYVRPTASGTGDGTSWNNASSDLQAMIDIPGPHQVFVAAGTYKPTNGCNREISFSMKPGVAIYGGFPATGIPGFSTRNPIFHVTRLSGDIGVANDHSDNSYHVISNDGNQLDHTALLDGFTVTEGNSTNADNALNFHGAGVFNRESSPAFNFCTFINNAAGGQGGGMYNEQADVLITTCIFSQNSSNSGGGLSNVDGSHTVITGTLFVRNTAVMNGGGVNNAYNTAMNLSDCYFVDNKAGSGGGLSNEHGTTAMLRDCFFAENLVQQNGGGVYTTDAVVTTMVNCVFLRNTASTEGLYGGSSLCNGINSDATLINCSFTQNMNLKDDNCIINLGTSLAITNSIVWDNGGGIYDEAATTAVNYSIVEGGYPGTGNLDEDPLFDIAFDGDLHLDGCSPAINTGTAVNAPNADFEGKIRPFHGGIDMGAYEFHGSLPVPVVVCQNRTIYLNEFGEATVNATDLGNGSAGCGDLTFKANGQDQLLFTCNTLGAQTVALTVTDALGRSATCNTTVTVVDNQAPVADCSPVDKVRNAAPGLCTFTPQHNGFNALIEDNCSATRINNYNNSASLDGVPFPVGNTPVIWTVTDASGNTATCTMNITIIDNQLPVVSCKNTTIVLNGESQVILKSDDLVASASDNCGIAGITMSPAAITCAQLNTVVPVTVTVTDASGNIATCTSYVTVTGLPCGWSQDPDGVNCGDGNSVTYNSSNQVFTATSINCYYAPPFTSDALAFAQYELCGNGSITAQVTGIMGTGWAGIIMRESNAAGAKKVQLTTNLNSNQSRREVRYVTNGDAYPQQFLSSNRFWLRLVRQGTQVMGYTSANGVQWFQTMAVTVSMNSCIEAGLVLSGFAQNSTVSATFANVSISGGSSSLAVATDGSMEAAAPSFDFSVYPNPTTGAVSVDLSAYRNHPVRLELYDLRGKMLQVLETAELTTAFDLSGYQNGIYLVRLIPEGLPEATKRVLLTGNK